MSRLGKRPIKLPSGISLEMTDSHIKIKKGNAFIEKKIIKSVNIESKDNNILILPTISDKNSITSKVTPLWGTAYSIINSMIHGIDKGFSTTIDIVGVGYKAEVSSNYLLLSLGYSHDIFLRIPNGVEAKCEKNTQITITSIDKELIGLFVALIQSLRKNDPYKGKGLYKKDQIRRRKKGKK